MPAIQHFEVFETRRVTVSALSISDAALIAAQAFKNGQKGSSALMDEKSRATIEYGNTTNYIETLRLDVKKT